MRVTRGVLSAIAAVLLVFAGQAGPAGATPQTRTAGPFQATFYGNGDSDGISTGEQDWTAQQMDDAAASILSWSGRITNSPGRQVVAHMFWNVLGGGILGQTYGPIYGNGTTSWSYPERIWRDGVTYAGPWASWDGSVVFDIGAGGVSGGWNFGAGPPSPQQIDFRSVVTHEAGHGVGLYATNYYGEGPGDGTWGGCFGTTTDPFEFAGYLGLSRWDKNLIDGTGNRPLSGGMGTPGNFDESSNPAWFTGASATTYYGGNVPVYAPEPYENGSSLSHLDETTFPNALMSPQIAPGEMIRQPTRLEWEIMKDLGWSVLTAKTWTKGAGTLSWADAANWGPNGAPDATWDVTLTGAGLAGGDVLNLAGNQTVNLLSIDASTSFTVGGSGGTLMIAKGNLMRTAASAGTQTIARPVALGASAIWDIAGSGQLAVSGAVSGTGFALEKRGAGVLVLSGANIYSGGTSVLGGTLLVNNTTDSGTGTGPVTVGAATLGGTGFINGPVTLTGDSTLTSTAALTINGTLTIQNLANQLAAGTVITTDDVTIDPGAVFIINGTLGGEEGYLIVRGTLMGKGTINKICVLDGGTLSPGEPSTIKTTAQVRAAAAPKNFSFEIGAASPNYASPSNSVNDVIRLTDAATPFADATGSAPATFSADTVIDVYFLWSDPALGEYKAEFFAATDYSAAVAGATYQYWRLDPRGSRYHNGNFYSPLDESLVDWSVVHETATFGGQAASGFITEFTVVPEPATLALVLMGVAGTLLRRRRR
jgi:autotransporter-associated beta strand protein